MIDLRNPVYKKEIPENKNSNKVISIIEKALDFTKQQKGRGLKLLTPKQMLQRLSRALVQVKAGNTSENVFNEIRQILCSLY